MGVETVLVLHKNYQFSTKDIGKTALLANNSTVKILTVIREAGQLHSVYGALPDYPYVVEWNADGKTQNKDHDIVMLFNEDELNDRQPRHQRQARI
jgi:hypothetical protein